MPRGRRAKLLLAIVWLGALLLTAAVWLVAIELAGRDRQEALARAQRDSGNLTHIIAEQAARAIADADRILKFLAFDLGVFGPDHAKLVDMMKDATSDSNLLLQLGYTDARGQVIASSAYGFLGSNLAIASISWCTSRERSPGRSSAARSSGAPPGSGRCSLRGGSARRTAALPAS